MRAPAVAGDRQGRVLELLNRLLSVPSEQTALMEREPAVTSFISGVVAPFLLTYAMTHAAAGMTDPYPPQVLDGGGYGISGPVVRGRGACEQKGPLVVRQS